MAKPLQQKISVQPPLVTNLDGIIIAKQKTWQMMIKKLINRMNAKMHSKHSRFWTYLWSKSACLVANLVNLVKRRTLSCNNKYPPHKHTSRGSEGFADWQHINTNNEVVLDRPQERYGDQNKTYLWTHPKVKDVNRKNASRASMTLFSKPGQHEVVLLEVLAGSTQANMCISCGDGSPLHLHKQHFGQGLRHKPTLLVHLHSVIGVGKSKGIQFGNDWAFEVVSNP